MRVALILQTTVGLGTLFAFGYFAAERYVGPPAAELAERSSVAEARAAAADVEVEWRAALAAQRRVVHAASTGPVIASLGESAGSPEGRAGALKAALGGIVELAGGAADAAVVGSRGESLVSVGERGPQLAGSSIVKFALAGSLTAGVDRVGNAPVLLAAAPIVDAAGVRGAVVLASVLDEARLSAWTARVPSGVGILLASEEEVLVGTLGEAKRQPIAVASLTGDTLKLDTGSYSIVSRPLVDDAGGSLRVFGLARRESPAAHAVVARTRLLVLALGGVALLLMSALALISPAPAAASSEDDELSRLLAEDGDAHEARRADKTPALSLDTVVAPPRKPTVPMGGPEANAPRSPVPVVENPREPAEAPVAQAAPSTAAGGYEIAHGAGAPVTGGIPNEVAQGATAPARSNGATASSEPDDLPGLRAGESAPSAPHPGLGSAGLSEQQPLAHSFGNGTASKPSGRPILDLPGLKEGDPAAAFAEDSIAFDETSPQAATPSDLPGLVDDAQYPGFGSAGLSEHGGFGSAGLSEHGGFGSAGLSEHGELGSAGFSKHGRLGSAGFSEHGELGSAGLSDLPGLRVGEPPPRAPSQASARVPPSDLPGLRANDAGAAKPLDLPGLRGGEHGRSPLDDLPGLRPSEASGRLSVHSDLPGLRVGEAAARGGDLPAFRTGESASRAASSDLPGLRAQESAGKPNAIELPPFRTGEAPPAPAPKPAEPAPRSVTSPFDHVGRRLSDAVRGTGVPQPVDVLGPRQLPREVLDSAPLEARVEVPAPKPLPSLPEEPSDLPGLPGAPPPVSTRPSAPASFGGLSHAATSEPLDLPGLKGGLPSAWPGGGPSQKQPSAAAGFVDPAPRGAGPSLEDFWKPRADAAPVPASEAPTQAFAPLSGAIPGREAPPPRGAEAEPSGTPLPAVGASPGTPLPNVRPVPAPFDEEHYRIVYNEFVGSKARLGEVVDNISYEGFSSKLRSSEKELIERHGCKAVRFQVLVKDRQVSLRPQLVR